MSTKIAPLEVRPVSDAAAGIVPKMGIEKAGKALVVQADGATCDWTGDLGGTGGTGGSEDVEFQKATSILAGLPYILSSDPSVTPVRSLSFGPALAGDVFLLEFYAEVFNENASSREVFGSILINGSSTQDSSAIQFAPVGALGSIQFFVMRIAIPLDAPGSPTFAARIWASDSDVKASQVCFSATKLGQ